MPATEDAKTGRGWQLYQVQQQVGEWIEFQLFRLRSPLPNFNPQ